MPVTYGVLMRLAKDRDGPLVPADRPRCPARAATEVTAVEVGLRSRPSLNR